MFIPPFLTDGTFWAEVGIALVILLVAVAVARVLLAFLRGVVRRLTRATDTRLDDAILAALRPPLFIWVLLVGLRLALTQISILAASERSRAIIQGFFFVAFTLLVYAAIYRTLRAVMTWYMHDYASRTDSKVDDALVPFLRRILLLTLSTATFVIILQHFNVPIGSFVATLGIGSLAVALAAQSTLSDLFAGFFIMMDRRYRVGDRIELTNAKVIGDVVDIGLRTTRILTMDHRMVIVPNTMLASNIVINHAYPDPNLRVDLPIGVAYGSDIDHVQEVLVKALSGLNGIHPERAIDVIFTGFGDSALELELRCWINVYADKPKLIGRINEAAYKALNAANIEIPYPQRVLWMKREASFPPSS